LVLAVLAALHIQPIGATPHGDRLAGRGIGPELAHAVLQHLALGLADLHRETPRVLAGGIVRAADEAAVAPELQADPPVAAGRAGARVGPILARREEVRAEILVQG